MVAEAGFVGFLRTLFYVICIIWLIRWASRILLPLLVRYLQRKIERKIHDQFKEQHTPPHSEKASSYREKNKIGEYIDYEELD